MFVAVRRFALSLFLQQLFQSRVVIVAQSEIREKLLAVKGALPVPGGLELAQGKRLGAAQISSIEVGIEEVGLEECRSLEIGARQVR